MKKKRLKVKKSVLFIGLGLIVLTAFILLQFTRMELMENVTELQVDFDSELSYTLTVTYDGVDRNGDKSSALLNTDGKPRIVKIDSGYIYVEDVLPEGLEFVKFNFEGNDNVVIGASKKDDTVPGTCKGYVENDSKGSTDPKSNHGLHYDEASRKVTFKIKNLTAGCKLSVGIVTKTPKTIEGKKKDFYNTATAWEGSQLVYSNMVHAWIQKAEVTSKKVTYQFTGTVPNGVTPPPEQEYVAGTTVGVAGNINVEGYTFSGWTILSPLGLTVTNGKFTMPDSNVVLQGSFTENPKYDVTYRIEGEGPSNYVLPTTKQYYENATVKVDSMSPGDTFSGYRFLGWNIEGIEVSEDKDFVMPARDIEIVGKWEQIKYKVTYAFHEGVRPPNYQEILDEINSKDNTYAPGEKVILPKVEDVAPVGANNGYHFQGWYESDGFTMPEKDVIVYGEWMIRRGVFAPTITKEIVDKKEYYRIGDVVKYKITVTNNAAYEIKNVQVKENHENAYFVSDGTTNYQVRSNHLAEIASIPADGSGIVLAEYIVTESDKGIITNEVEIIGALADENNSLDTTKEYKDTAEFKVQSKLEICKNVDKISNNNLFQFTITGSNFKTNLNIEGNTCKSVYLVPGEYSVTENPNQEYRLDTVTGSITTNGGSVTIENNKEYSITFNNKLKNQGFFRTFGNVINEVRGTE